MLLDDLKLRWRSRGQEWPSDYDLYRLSVRAGARMGINSKRSSRMILLIIDQPSAAKMEVFGIHWQQVTIIREGHPEKSWRWVVALALADSLGE